MRRRLSRLLAASLVLVLLSGLLLGYGVFAKKAPSTAVEVEIRPGASVRQMARLLASKGVIHSSLLFEWLVRLQGHASGMTHGYYRFEEPANMLTVMERIRAGDVMHFQVTIPEGLRNEEIVRLLSERTGVSSGRWQRALLKVVPGGRDGYLLPETYRYEKPVDPESLLMQMRRAQERLLGGIETDVGKWDRLRVMASIIEKETALDSERPLIAAVIENRLRRGMPLQMDPTVIYGLWRTKGSFSGNLRKRDLLTDTPWNTYTRRGLPPTPICNPGAASLRAAANPANVPFLYFVADGSGGHAFASSLEEHRRNVARWVHLERRRK